MSGHYKFNLFFPLIFYKRLKLSMSPIGNWKSFKQCMSYQDYKEKPDYGRCVSIVASASLQEMIKPGALAIISPIVIGGFSFYIPC